MRPLMLLTCAALALGGLGAGFAPARDAVRFAPKSGSKVSKTFNEHSETNSVSLAMRINGEERPAPEGFSLSNESTTEIAFTDAYVALAGGKPTELKRHFDKLKKHSSRSTGGDEGASDTDEESPLEGS